MYDEECDSQCLRSAGDRGRRSTGSRFRRVLLRSRELPMLPDNRVSAVMLLHDATGGTTDVSTDRLPDDPGTADVYRQSDRLRDRLR